MNESTKTLSFVAAAAVLLLGAYMLRPAPIVEAQDDMGKEFFPDFQDPLKAASLEVVEYDDLNGMVRPFKVARVNGVWSIPSHENYPADAENQLKQAAVSVMGLKKLNKVSDSPADHVTYGVIDPDAAKLESGASTGMGKRVTLEDKDGNKLAQFIIGKKDADQPDLHYVRVPGQDRVYLAKVKTDKLSTKFNNWIEEDLLKLNPFDVKEVVINDHSVDEVRGAILQREIAVVDYDNKESKWKLMDLKAFDPKTGKWKETKLAADEELDTQKLNDLKTALDDLKIVDVVHKPPGLSKDLRVAEELATDPTTRKALMRKGFYLVPTPDGVELFSNEGETRCGLTDGVEYVLRFGESAGQGREDEDDDAQSAGADKDGAEKKDANKDKGVDRYIMVTARFREDLIPKPELTPLPEGSDDTSGKPPKDGAASAPRAEETLLALADDARPIALAQAAKGGAAKAAQPSAAAKSSAKAPADDKPAAEEKPAAEQTPAEVDPDAAAEAAEKANIAKAAERKRIEEENKRKEDEYKKKVEAGEKRVKDLNGRFADWYFVISDKTYQKIHIGRDQLVKKKAAEGEAEGTKPAATGGAKAPPKTPPRKGK